MNWNDVITLLAAWLRYRSLLQLKSRISNTLLLLFGGQWFLFNDCSKFVLQRILTGKETKQKDTMVVSQKQNFKVTNRLGDFGDCSIIHTHDECQYQSRRSGIPPRLSPKRRLLLNFERIAVWRISQRNAAISVEICCCLSNEHGRLQNKNMEY